MRQIFPFSSIRTVTVGFGISPNLLTPPIARRALAGFDDRSPLPPVGTFTPPRERGRTEIRPIQLTHPSPSHATLFASSAARFRRWRPRNVQRARRSNVARNPSEKAHRRHRHEVGGVLAEPGFTGMVPVHAHRTAFSSRQMAGPDDDVRSGSAVRASDASTP